MGRTGTAQNAGAIFENLTPLAGMLEGGKENPSSEAMGAFLGGLGRTPSYIR